MQTYFFARGFSKMLRNRLSNRNTGIYCLVIGVIIAIAGVFFWVTGHGVRGPILLVVAVVVLAFGGYAFMSSKKTTSTR